MAEVGCGEAALEEERGSAGVDGLDDCSIHDLGVETGDEVGDAGIVGLVAPRSEVFAVVRGPTSTLLWAQGS